MMKTCLLLFFLTVLSAVWTKSRKMHKCEIAQELYQHGIRNDLEDWVCLVLSRGGGRKNFIGGPYADGSFDYGLFQINSRYWCGVQKAGGECDILCKSLLDDDITDDVACARKISARHGFGPWIGWHKHCNKGKPLPNLSECQL